MTSVWLSKGHGSSLLLHLGMPPMASLISLSHHPKALPYLPASSSPLTLHKPFTPKSFNPCNISLRIVPTSRSRLLRSSTVCRSSLEEEQQQQQNTASKSGVDEEEKLGGNEENGGDWTTSILLLGLWGVLMFYVFNLTPNQTPVSSSSSTLRSNNNGL